MNLSSGTYNRAALGAQVAPDPLEARLAGMLSAYCTDAPVPPAFKLGAKAASSAGKTLDVSAPSPDYV